MPMRPVLFVPWSIGTCVRSIPRWGNLAEQERVLYLGLNNAILYSFDKNILPIKIVKIVPKIAHFALDRVDKR